jgi:hypothetical protein
MSMTTSASIAPAVPAAAPGGKKLPFAKKNPFVKAKGGKGVPQAKAKGGKSGLNKGKIDSMVASLKD